MSQRWLAPRLWPLHLLAVVAVAVCTLMGLWQLGIYGSKHDDAAAVARAETPVALLTVWGPDEAFSAELTARPVWVRGAFTGEQFVVRRDPPVGGGETLFWAVAPLQVDGTESSLLIVRGSTPDRTALPEVPVGTVNFRAVLQPSEGRNSAHPFDPDSGVYGSLSIPQLANVVKGDVFSGFALTDATGVNGGLTPVEPPDPEVAWTVGLRNLAYALQWWVFGLFSLFMWWRMVSDALDVEAAVADEASGS